MQTYKHKKRPDEIVIAEWSFSDRMAETETISSRTATSSDLTISDVGATEDDRGVACLVEGGDDADDSVIKFGVVTSLGQELFDEVILRIRADPFGST